MRRYSLHHLPVDYMVYHTYYSLLCRYSNSVYGTVTKMFTLKHNIICIYTIHVVNKLVYFKIIIYEHCTSRKKSVTTYDIILFTGGYKLLFYNVQRQCALIV